MAGRQLSLADESQEYRDFVDKFKPKKTTDDCYTPQLVYDAVAGWVESEYGLDRSGFVRPFWPGGDYEREDYPPGCTVVDNPPFSILAKIMRFYLDAGVRFFLFAPGMTCLTRLPVTSVCAMCDVTYANGANVRTSFVTNLEEGIRARSAPELTRLVDAANDENLKAGKVHTPKYEFPDHVVTASKLGWMSVHGTDLRIRDDECAFISTLDAMKASGKSGLFGGGCSSPMPQRRNAQRRNAQRRNAQRRNAQRRNAQRLENGSCPSASWPWWPCSGNAPETGNPGPSGGRDFLVLSDS